MTKFRLRIENKNGRILAEKAGDGAVHLVYEHAYEEGDVIILEMEGENRLVHFQPEDTLGPSLCYITGTVTYQIPFGEKKRVYSPKAFSGEKHYICAREAEEGEGKEYRNLALNTADQHVFSNCYPHASANVETRGESVFEAKNAIDGVKENHSHGDWPYASWGINRDPNAQMKLEFGRKVRVDALKIYLRADFPHDSYWTEGTVTFSDGTTEVLRFTKTDRGQKFSIREREIEWLTFGKLKKAEDESPFPALTQLEVYGRDA